VVTHFNTTVSTFYDQFQPIGMRRHGCQVGFPHSPPIVQIALSSVKLRLSSKLIALLCLTPLYTYFVPLKLISMLFEVILYFYCWHLLSSWNEICILHCKWIPTLRDIDVCDHFMGLGYKSHPRLYCTTIRTL
jgi:hypothetical protein